jgi:hypothetical protein
MIAGSQTGCLKQTREAIGQRFQIRVAELFAALEPQSDPRRLPRGPVAQSIAHDLMNVRHAVSGSLGARAALARPPLPIGARRRVLNTLAHDIQAK